MLIGAINVARLKQSDMAEELIRRVNYSTLTSEDTDLLAQARTLIEEG
jgi:hypothetical protein